MPIAPDNVSKEDIIRFRKNRRTEAKRATTKIANQLRSKIEHGDEDIDRAEERYEEKLQYLEKVQDEFLLAAEIDGEKDPPDQECLYLVNTDKGKEELKPVQEG